MKATVGSIALNEALQILRAATGGGDPLLRAVLIEANGDGTLRFTATDTYLQITSRVTGQVATPGRTAVDLTDLSSAARHLPKEADAKIGLDDGRLVISADRTRFQFGVHDVDKFPGWRQETGGPDSTPVSGEILGRRIDAVLHAIAADDARPVLAGVLLTNHGGQTNLRVVATDGHRLALNEIPEIQIDLPESGIVIPRRTAREIVRLCQGRGLVGLSITPTTIRIDADHEILLSKLIEGSYPDYRAITAQQHGSAAAFDRKALMTSVQRVSAFLDRNAGIQIDIGTDEVGISARRDESEASETIQADPAEGAKAASIGLSPYYLLDALKSLTANRALIQYTSPSHPVTIIGTDGEDPKLILMTRRI
jgi:DNA polymerase-3 subunit beta